MYSNKEDVLRNKYVEKIQSIIHNEKISRCIEQDIYNYCIKLSKDRFIKRNWDNTIFKNLYR